ncbi:MAG: deoxyribonuclease IV [Conexivisphaerales archaeon]
MSKADQVLLGVHVSISGSIDLAVDRALTLGCTTFQMFTRNPQGWKYAELAEESVKLFKSKLKKSNIKVAVDHMPYLPNLSSPVDSIYQKSLEALTVELRRADSLNLQELVVHLGSHMGKGLAYGQRRLAEAVRKALNEAEPSCHLLLENMSGQKNAVGASIDDLSKIMKLIGDDERVGVCLDTCHLYAAGYDITTESGIDKLLEDFDSMIGIDRLRVVHLNDSKGELGSGLDRHENIGKGYIGKKGFKNILAREEITSKPLILETPVGSEEDYRTDMKTVRELLKDC